MFMPQVGSKYVELKFVKLSRIIMQKPVTEENNYL